MPRSRSRPSGASKAAVGQDEGRRRDRHHGRQRVIVPLQIVPHELRRQMHGAAKAILVLDVEIDVLLDQLGAFHLVHTRESTHCSGVGSLVIRRLLLLGVGFALGEGVHVGDGELARPAS